MGNVVQPLWADCPALTRIAVAGYPVLGLSLTVTSGIGASVFDAVFDDTYNSVVLQWHVWSMFVGCFGRKVQNGMDFIMIMIEMYMMMMYFPNKERDLGSTTMLAWILLYNGLISAVFLVLARVLGALTLPMTGFWPLVMVLLTQRCLAHPTDTANLFGLAQIPNKWYPVVLAGLIMLMRGMSIPWSVLAALAVGYGSQKVHFEKVLPSRVRASRFEQRFRCLSARPCLGTPWIMAANTAAYEVETGDRRYATLGDFGRSGGQSLVQGRTVQPAATSGSGGGGNFVAFAGQGNRLGEAETPLPEIPVSSAPPQAAFAPVAPEQTSTPFAASPSALGEMPDGI